MVSWFHQTELTTVLDLARCEEFRRRLDAHGIPYKVKGKDRSSPVVQPVGRTGADRCFLPERQPGQAIRDLCFPGKSFPGPSGDRLGSEAIARCSVPGRENV